MTPEEFAQALAAKGITLTDQQKEQFATYFQYLVSENEKMNLTAITAEGDVYLKHFYDSVTPLTEIPELRTAVVKLCDVGAGAGFPSLPMKILNPQLQITIVDSLQKRIDFLDRLCKKLHLTGVELVHDRAETFAGKKSPYREQFDLVTARAVAALPVLAELCLPLVRIGGQFIALKAAQAPNELTAAKPALKLLGGNFDRDIAFKLPVLDETRHLLVIDKAAATPKKYPRKPGTPAKQPIGG
ncbi:16S rRNA (guanine(527)-N(7))-methyltransferase RsmG [Lacticaseibacillus songhuajiangensis]|jgi:16S rRNA (guanine527-N7)-methyltransferase|uniref:16S rRNA (guanine(527)-N(7))-methyltransferase RsmG n=1 Tax=Lacticaseibacillus songhuajiangensis TaxID=1296539 RepID=UPI000F79BE3F|nr:16S rRNA (guanine(527)-N(7))-methyltransferase RsmG [Lacticaseibacillus songhuajiangensis]